jgi:uncharacterized protein YdiU (UPF0061 family)
MRQTNPRILPRNYLVHQTIAAAEAGNLTPLKKLHDALRTPYEAPADPALQAKRPEWARTQAGCSMLSCSS